MQSSAKQSQILQPTLTLQLPESMKLAYPQKLIPLQNGLLVVMGQMGKYGVIDLSKKTPSITLHEVTKPQKEKHLRFYLEKSTPAYDGRGELTNKIVGFYNFSEDGSAKDAIVIDLNHPSFPRYRHTWWPMHHWRNDVYDLININQRIIFITPEGIKIGHYNNDGRDDFGPKQGISFEHPENIYKIKKMKNSTDTFFTQHLDNSIHFWKFNDAKVEEIHKISIINKSYSIISVGDNSVVIDDFDETKHLKLYNIDKKKTIFFEKMEGETISFDNHILQNDNQFIRYARYPDQKVFAEVWDIKLGTCINKFETISNPKDLQYCSKEYMGILEQDKITLYHRNDLLNIFKKNNVSFFKAKILTLSKEISLPSIDRTIDRLKKIF